MSNRVKGKVAVVTGSSKGLGAAIARALGAEGAHVVVNYSSSADAADQVVKSITDAGGTACAVKANMSVPADVETLFLEANRAFGRVDILVNNAGVYDFQPIQNLTVELYRRHFDLNVLGYLLAIRESLKFMRRGASIVNMGSTVTIFGPTNASVYTATKGAIDGMTRALSNELGPHGIRVNSIKPGVVDTDGVKAGGFLDTEFGTSVLASTPLGRLGMPEDIAPAAVYLASDESSWMTGETLVLSGGQR